MPTARGAEQLTFYFLGQVPLISFDRTNIVTVSFRKEVAPVEIYCDIIDITTDVAIENKYSFHVVTTKGNPAMYGGSNVGSDVPLNLC